MRLRKVMQGILSVTFFVVIFQCIFFLAGIFLPGTCNADGAFSLSLPSSLIIFFSISVLLLFFFFWLGEDERSLSFAWIILMAAGASNLLERIFFGCVYDYIHVPYFTSFNAADAFLTVSIVYFFIVKMQNKTA